MAKEYLEKLSDFIKATTAGGKKNIHLECKHFFGGAALYAEKRICISLTPLGLGIKLPEETKNKLLKDKKAIPLRYFPKGPIKKSYVLFPGGVEKSGKEFDYLVSKSIEYVLTLPKPKKKQK